MKTRKCAATVVVSLLGTVAVAQAAEAYDYFGEVDCPGDVLGETDNWEHLLELVEADIVNSHKNWWLGACNNW